MGALKRHAENIYEEEERVRKKKNQQLDQEWKMLMLSEEDSFMLKAAVEQQFMVASLAERALTGEADLSMDEISTFLKLFTELLEYCC